MAKYTPEMAQVSMRTGKLLANSLWRASYKTGATQKKIKWFLKSKTNSENFFLLRLKILCCRKKLFAPENYYLTQKLFLCFRKKLSAAENYFLRQKKICWRRNFFYASEKNYPLQKIFYRVTKKVKRLIEKLQGPKPSFLHPKKNKTGI